MRPLDQTWLGERRRIVAGQHARRSRIKIVWIGWELPHAGIDVVAERIDAYAMSVPPRALHSDERGYLLRSSRGGKDANDRKHLGAVLRPRAEPAVAVRVRTRASIPAAHIGIKGLDIGASDLRKRGQDGAGAQIHHDLRVAPGAPDHRRVGQRIDIDPTGIAAG